MTGPAGGSDPSRAGLRRSILEFLATANPHRTVDTTSLSDDDNLFDLGLVDSVTLADLLVTVERLAGVELDLLAVDPETFFTLRGLLDHVDGPRSAAAADRP
jgi:acyl carrier protein